MENFCPDPFFNFSQSWNTSNPKLSRCMTDTVLTAVPCLILWVILPVWSKCDASGSLYHYSSNGSPARSKLTWIKLFLTLVLIANAVGELIARSTSSVNGLFPSEWFHFACVISTLLLALVTLLLLERITSASSPCLFIFWFLSAVCSIPRFKQQVEEIDMEETTDWNLVVQAATEYPVILLQLVAASFSDRRQEVQGAYSPEYSASFLSTLYYSWMDSLVWNGRKCPITLDKVPKPLPFIQMHLVAARFIGNWQRKIETLGIIFHRESSIKAKKKISVLPVLWKTFGGRIVFSFLLGLLQYTLLFVNPQLVKLLIRHVQNGKEEAWKGYFYSCATLLAGLLISLVFHQTIRHLVIVGLNMRGALTSMIYRKTLRLSSAARKKYTTGEIINYMSTDAQKLLDSFSDFSNLWFAPFRIAIAVYFLFQELGNVAFAGVGLMAILIPLNVWSTRKRGARQKELMEKKDCRMKLVSELLAGIKVIKLYAWEIPFLNRIKVTRDQEVGLFRAIGKLWTLINTTFSSSNFFITLSIFGLYSVVNPSSLLTADKIFVSIALLNILKAPMTTLPFGIVAFSKLSVAVNRINSFLNAEELDSEAISGDLQDPDRNAVEVTRLTASWGEDDVTPQLKDVSFKVAKGSLTAVVGVVGSGKSTLLSAILGDLRNEEGGSVAVQGSVAYVPQLAWIQNMTLKENVLLKKPLLRREYGRVIAACALGPDLKILAKGDETEIGENGITLSGGQKQRVSLARAIYQDADVYLLDDPLSAVDAHVGRHIFDHVFSSDKGLIGDKTRILVTNDISYLRRMDQIIVLKNGTIVKNGTYQELLSNGSEFAAFLSAHNSENAVQDPAMAVSSNQLDSPDELEIVDKEADGSESDDERNTLLVDPNDNTGRLTADEATQVGKVSWSVYIYYLKCMSYPVCGAICLMFLGAQGIQTGSSWWLSRWADSNANSSSANQAGLYLGVYAGMGFLQIGLEITQSLTLFLCAARASKFIHDRLLDGIIRSPMFFFDTHPTGRIVNRFSSDLGNVDTVLPFQLSAFCGCLSRILLTFGIICYVVPIFIPVILPLVLLYTAIQRCYIQSSRQLKRLDGISKSPIYSHFGESINGASSIRAYKVEERFTQESESRVEQQSSCYYQCICINRWLAVRTEFLASLVVFVASLLAVLARDSITPGLAGLVITYAMEVTATLTLIIRLVCDMETDSISLERILEYTKVTPEADWFKETDTALDNWPRGGKIEFEDYQTRYRPDLDLVLKQLNLCIEPLEKVGICGRTGAGKSSLALALFRLIEPTNGRILVDGVDTSGVGLQKLRSGITIIPQDPVLFSGSLRFNLDPIGERSDGDIWTSLEHAGLRSLAETFPEGLEHEVSEKGENFSVGQRQLICLARALLRKTKVLILDEATAAVDLETDKLIQRTIRTEFRDCTVITIAHRLNTILDCDRVAVFGEGRLIELGEPQRLLAVPESQFCELARNAGIVR